MERNNILLSSGSLPWLGIKDIIKVSKMANFDGIELVPTRKIISEFSLHNISSSELKKIKSIHQSWRLDIDHDKEYGIRFPITLFFTALRFLFFPKINESNKLINSLSKNLNIPVTVHGLSDKWTKDNQGKEFLGGISYEIMDTSTNTNELKDWMRNTNHSIVVDSRDDQSLIWAKKYGFADWKELWKWLGLKKIKNIQLTLIGPKGLKKIINRKSSLAEEQLLWLNNQKWKESVTIEVNPIILFLLYKGNIKKGLEEICLFAKQTLIRGRKWS